MSEGVMLRPVRADDLTVLERLTQDPEVTGEFEWSGWYDLRLLRRGWDDNGLIGPDGGILMVVRDDERLGGVNWRRHETTPAAHCWEVGIELRAAMATGRKRTGCWCATCSRTRRCTGSRR
jgi:hypothetical protein